MILLSEYIAYCWQSWDFAANRLSEDIKNSAGFNRYSRLFHNHLRGLADIARSLPSSLAPMLLALKCFVAITGCLPTNWYRPCLIHRTIGTERWTQYQKRQSLSRQDQSEFGRLYNLLERYVFSPPNRCTVWYARLSSEDLVSFAFCRWDLFQELTGFTESKAKLSLESLGHLATFSRKSSQINGFVSIRARSERPILRDIGILVELFEKSHWPKE